MIPILYRIIDNQIKTQKKTLLLKKKIFNSFDIFQYEIF